MSVVIRKDQFWDKHHPHSRAIIHRISKASKFHPTLYLQEQTKHKPMITKIPGNEAKDKEQTDQRTRTFLHWCVYVSKYIYIYNLVLVRSIEMIHQCMGSRGARGRTGVFDGLTLIGNEPRTTPLQLRAAIALSAITNSTKAIRVEW